MRSRLPLPKRSRLLVSSLAVSLFSVVVITISVAVEWWTLAAVVAALLLGATLVVAADADRQARMVRRRLSKMYHLGQTPTGGGPGGAKGTGMPFAVGAGRDGVRGVPTPALGGPDVETPMDTTRADMLGAVRVLQAQYTARLDRLQATVEEAMMDLRRDEKEQSADTGRR